MSWLQESFDRKAEPLWEAFNLTGLQLSRLADRRRRTPKGQFADEISQLSVAGDSKTIGNVTVTRVSDGAGIPEFKVEARLKGQSGSTEFVLGAGTAAARAEDASAADTHPDSLGGTTSYPNAITSRVGGVRLSIMRTLRRRGRRSLVRDRGIRASRSGFKISSVVAFVSWGRRVRRTRSVVISLAGGSTRRVSMRAGSTRRSGRCCTARS